MNLLSVFAAYGVVSLAASGGWFGELFGIHEPTPVPGFIPLMMFAILFGLSMDYEVFLLSRIREEYHRSGDNSRLRRRRPRRHRPSDHRRRGDHDRRLRRLRAQRPGLPQAHRPRHGHRHLRSTPPSCGWCSSRPRCNCSANATGGSPAGSTGSCPNLDVDGPAHVTAPAETNEPAAEPVAA